MASNGESQTMRVFKFQAKALRRYLAQIGIDLTHSQALECVARLWGRPSWNHAVPWAKEADAAMAANEEGVPEGVARSRGVRNESD